MKNRLHFLAVLATLLVLLLSHRATAQCTAWKNPTPITGWSDFNTQFGGAPCNDGIGCPFYEIDDFGVTAAEAYAVNNFIEGGTYAFSMCNGIGAGSWVPEFTIIAPSGHVDAFGPGDGDSCTITWTATESGTYLIVINEAGFCGGSPNEFNFNGFPALTCLGNTPCGGCEAGEIDSTQTVGICPGETFTIINSPSTIPAGGGQGLYFSNSQGGTGALGVSFLFYDTPDTTEIDASLGGILSANNLPLFSGTWVVYIATYDNPNDPGGSICDFSMDSLVVNFSQLQLVNVTNIANGSATAQPMPSSGTYTFLWSNGQTTQTATGLVDGEPYSVTVSDGGCSVSDSFIAVGIPEPCLDWQFPSPTTGYTTFNTAYGGAPCDDGTGCPTFTFTGFEVWAAEAYQVDNFIAGGTYAFNICNGPGAGSWVPEFTIISPSGQVDAFGPGDGDGCTITWTATESGTYLIAINSSGDCGGGVFTFTNNGNPSLTCLGGASCPLAECIAGELTSTNPVPVCGPSATFIATVNDDDIRFPDSGGMGWLLSDAPGGTGGLPGGFVLLDSDASIEYNSDLNGLLSGGGAPKLAGLWSIRHAIFDNANDPSGSICSLSEDSLLVNFVTDVPTVTAVDNGNGSATATATGGIAPYTYLWSTGQTTPTITDLPSGLYTVVATDANFCWAIDSVDLLSSVGQIKSLQSLVISPNPTEGKFIVEIVFEQAAAIQVSILDITGREIQHHTAISTNNAIKFDLSAEPCGVYLMRLTTVDGVVTRKFLVSR
ncbi:MAG: T9SS type A sorting domain-containing protein [Saprospiraceae bacterium]|nr:T9SS type A sorting domain-containing protein [Saprospiraceae bacterium]